MTDFVCCEIAANTVLFSGDITEESSAIFYKTFLNLADSLSSKSDKKINIILNSGGGCLSSGLSMYDLVNSYKNVEILCVGFVGSSATLMLYATDNVFSYANTRFLLHQVSTSTQGKLTDVSSGLLLSQDYQKTVIEIYNKRSDIVTSEYLIVDKFLTAKEALEIKLITNIKD